MTETARLADYVLPAPTQFEKYEATFFNFEFPRNVFHLRRPVLDPPDGPLPEPEIHARLVEATRAAITAEQLDPLRQAAQREPAGVRRRLPVRHRQRPDARRAGTGRALPHARADAARRCGSGGGAVGRRPALRRWRTPRACAGPGSATASTPASGSSTRSWPARRASCSPTTTYDDVVDACPARTTAAINLVIPELLEELGGAWRTRHRPGDDSDWPFLLSAGERRSFTANTIIRDPAWRKKDGDGALRVSPSDADRLGLADGGLGRLTTKRASAEVDDRGRRHDAARPRVAAERARTRSRRGRSSDRDRDRAQRVDRERGPRPVGRHAVAQVGAGASRSDRMSAPRR